MSHGSSNLGSSSAATLEESKIVKNCGFTVAGIEIVPLFRCFGQNTGPHNFGCWNVTQMARIAMELKSSPLRGEVMSQEVLTSASD